MKLSIVAEGGGLRGAYAAGAVHALHQHFGLKKADYVTGSSASIATLAYYAAGQVDTGIHIWPNELPNHKFLSLRNILKGRPILDIDYLVDEVFKKKVPLDEKKLKESKTKIIVPLTNIETGEAEYFDNTTNFDFFEILRAAMAAPIIYSRSVSINGSRYFDGSFSDPLPMDHPEIKKSIKIVILTKRVIDSEKFKAEKLLSSMLRWKLKPQLVRIISNSHYIYKKKLEQVAKAEQNGCIVIRPSKSMSRFDNKSESIKANMQQGYQDTISNPKLAEFIKHLKETKRN